MLKNTSTDALIMLLGLMLILISFAYLGLNGFVQAFRKRKPAKKYGNSGGDPYSQIMIGLATLGFGSFLLIKLAADLIRELF